MYLTCVFIQNSGPLRRVELVLPFNQDAPVPFLVVGSNGSGKTNFLSLIADALFECAAAHYSDVLPMQGPMGRNWFRVVGGSTITAGAKGGCAILKFRHNEAMLTYFEKGGTFPLSAVHDATEAAFYEGAQWDESGAVKSFTVGKSVAEEIFQQGAYVYFPSSRAETPFWLNRVSVPSETPDFEDKFNGRLGKPIFVERGIDKLRKWLTTLLVESRMEVRTVLAQAPESNQPQVRLQVVSDQVSALAHQVVWDHISVLLKIILDDESAGLVWLGQSRGVGFVKGDGSHLSLSALSAGQATLFNIFGTLLRYANENGIALRPENVVGICLVDEIDAHMHVDLQYRALPKLIGLFPRVQFILSSHSPLFTLGMTRKFGDSLSIVDLPSGREIQAESYAEFGNALEAFEDTKVFQKRIETLSANANQAKVKLLVLLEGETDPAYLKAATKALGREGLLQVVDLKWVGYHDAEGNAKHTGSSTLNSLYKSLSVKPEIAGPPILLLYDCDEQKTAVNLPRIFVRSIAPNAENEDVTKGIENLLPLAVFTENMYVEKVEKLGTGRSKITPVLQKTKLCDSLCAAPDPEVFKNFGPVLDMIEEIANGLG